MLRTFCVKCGEFRDYNIDLRRRTAEDRYGLIYDYPEIEARCRECGEEVYVPILNDQNVVARMDAYRAALKKEAEQ